MESFLLFLQNALAAPLPGVPAQAKMMPSLSDKSRFSPAAKVDARDGGVMLLIYEKNGEIFLPLIQRPDYDGVHAKQVSFPGGKADSNDKDLVFTALRETEEEIGIPVDKIKVIGTLTELYIIASNFNVLPVVAYIDEYPTFKADEFEVDEIITLPLLDLVNDRLQKEKPLSILNGITINAPYFDIHGKTVWGATAMILSEFKTIIQPFFKHL